METYSLSYEVIFSQENKLIRLISFNKKMLKTLADYVKI
jgi:hypothetical protein